MILKKRIFQRQNCFRLLHIYSIKKCWKLFAHSWLWSLSLLFYVWIMWKVEVFIKFVFVWLSLILYNLLVFFRIRKINHYLNFVIFALGKINSIVKVVVKMIVVIIFLKNEKVNFYHRYMLYHMVLSIIIMRIKY